MNNSLSTIDATTIIITTKDNKILLQQRDDNPNIEFPGFLGLISGYINSDETPLQALIRELKEEITHKKSSKVSISAITYLGTVQRFDYKRNDYVHHAFLKDNADDLVIKEGKGLVFLSFEECFKAQKLAPHHNYHLHRFQDKILKIDKEAACAKDFDNYSLSDLIKIIDLANGKNLDELEKGVGFYAGEGSNFTSLLHTDEDIKFIAFLNFQPDEPRGKHYHLKKVEFMLLLNGEMKFELRTNDNDKTEVILKKGQIIRILPSVIHTLTAIGTTVSTIEFSPQRFVNSDVYKLK